MPLTQAQKEALKTAILAEPSIANCVAGGNDVCVSEWLNSTSTFVVWRTQISQDEYQSEVGPTGSQFDWASTGGYIARSQGERDAWKTMFANTYVNPSKTNVRSAFNDIFSGSGAGAVNNRAHLLALSKRLATNAEMILATGAGTDTDPGLMIFEGSIGINEIGSILRQ